MSGSPLGEDRFTPAGAGVAALFAALPFAAMGGALVFAPCLAVAGVIALPWARLRHAAGGAGLPLYMVGGFLFWVALSTLWAAHPDWRAPAPFVAFAPCALAFLMAAGLERDADRALVRRAGLAGLALLLALVATEARFDYPLARQLSPPVAAQTVPAASPQAADRIHAPVGEAPAPAKTRDAGAAVFIAGAARAATIALVLFWGAAAALAPRGWRGWVAIAALAGAVLPLSWQFGGALDLAALGLGAVGALIAFVWPRAAVSILAQTAAAGIVLAPLILPQIVDLAGQALTQFTGVDPPFAWQARAESWAYTADRIKEKLFLGWGFHGSRTFTETYNLLGFTLPYIPRHPLNAPLQIWLETGAVGALLAAGALASFGRRAGAALAEDRTGAAAAAGLLVTASVFANVAMDAWALWWWGAIAASAALMRTARRPA